MKQNDKQVWWWGFPVWRPSLGTTVRKVRISLWRKSGNSDGDEAQTSFFKRKTNEKTQDASKQSRLIMLALVMTS